MRPQRKKFIYVQNWGTYRSQTVVGIRATPKDVLAYLKRTNSSRDFVREYEHALHQIEHRLAGADGACWFADNGGSALLLPVWGNKWPDLDCLNHEVAHLVHRTLGHQKGMMDEDEARAYQHEFLFREIRQRLNGR